MIHGRQARASFLTLALMAGAAQAQELTPRAYAPNLIGATASCGSSRAGPYGSVTMATTDPILTALALMEERLTDRIDDRFRDLQLDLDGRFDAVLRRLDSMVGSTGGGFSIRVDRGPSWLKIRA